MYKTPTIQYSCLWYFFFLNPWNRDATEKIQNKAELQYVTKIEMPPPIMCQPDICDVKATCRTTFIPRMGPSLLDLVTSPKDIKVVPITDYHTASKNTEKSWHTQLYFCDTGAISYMRAKGFNYLDHKIILQGEQSSGPLKLEITTTRENPIVLCSAPSNDHIAKSAKWFVDGKEATLLTEGELPAAGLPQVNKPCWMTKDKYPAGKHELEVQPLPPFVEHDAFIPFSHLIHW